MSEEQEEIKDIPIPKDLQDGCYIISTHKLLELTASLFQNDLCPLTSEIRKQIEPKKIAPAETERCFNMFVTIHKSHVSYFKKIPIFSILYSARCLQNKILFKIAIDFITNFLKSLESPPNEDVLDILIPFTIYRQYIQDKPPVIVPFLLFLCERFGTKIFMNHLLKVLDVMVRNEYNNCKIGHFHIEMLIAILESYELSQNEVDKIEEKILVPLAQDETAPIRLSCSALEKAIESTPARRESASNSPAKSSISIPEDSLSFDKLISYLDDIESKSYVSGPVILANILIQFEIVKKFPLTRSVQPLFELAMHTFPETTESHRSNIYYIVSFLNNNIDPATLLPLYLSAARDDLVNLEFAERCYQEFRTITTNNYKNSESGNNVLDEAPETLLDNTPMPPMSPRSAVKLAFDSIKCWDTAYEGVQKIWSAITKNPDVDLIDYVDELEYSQQSYLIQGLCAIQEDCEPIQGTKEALNKIEDYIVQKQKRLESQMKFAASPAKTPKSPIVKSPEISRRGVTDSGRKNRRTNK